MYRYHDRFGVKHLLAFPSFKLSLWQFLKIILAWFDPKVGIVLSEIYGLSTGYKSIVQHTAQKLETLTEVKLTTEILITQQIQIFMLILKQRFVSLL